jgi:fused signal recognition particle receptor
MGLFGNKNATEKSSWLGKLKQGLTATRNLLSKRVNDLFFGGGKLDEEMLSQLEEILITSDVGVETAIRIVDDLRRLLKSGSIKTPEELRDALKSELLKIMGTEPTPLLVGNNGLGVLMVIGVNGTGKTTAIGKIANKFRLEGKNVIIAAGDTFRAAAIDQLEVWAQRAKCQLIKHNPGADPAAVVFDALAAAKARKSDLLIIDTAGRLHTKSNLMEELKKVNRVLLKESTNLPKETLLVLDATTGQNALQQAKIFSEAAEISGIILTKLDGTAKGGIVITIADEMKIPVKLIGVGEGIDDLREFNPTEFVNALFEN